jgi:ssDNA-binding Zn-finger/Zn-ribbon topoisomerase 1
MEPTRNTHATLVDLLDRILDKGLVINADIIISVAGIPLIGVNLRAALAGMETMLKYGVMQAWDEKSRVWEREHRKRQEVSLLNEEEVSLKIYGSYYYSKGIYTAWRSGYFYLTNKRLILWNGDFNEIIFQISLEKIKGLIIKSEKYFTEGNREILYLIGQDDKVERIHTIKTGKFKEKIEHNLKVQGIFLKENYVLPEFEEGPIDILTEGEKVTHREKKVWYLLPAQGILKETWRPGHLYLTNKRRLCWWNYFERKLVFDLPLDRIIGVTVEMRKTSEFVSNGEKVLDIIYQVNSTRRIASFSGKQIDEWVQVLRGIISDQRDEEIETCPQCGKTAPQKELLEKGCSNCGWISPRIKQKTEDRKRKIVQAAK